MDDCPEVVNKIADDYLERLKSQLRLVPARERDEFVCEIRSHIYEAYREAGGDDVARILGVLRNLGEPAEVVADRLPDAIVRSGRSLNLPLHVVAGILIALFGIPLGIGGVATLAGVLVALASMVAAYYAVTWTILFVAATFMVLGLARIFLPGLWDRLVSLGVIQINGPTGAFFDQLPGFEQGLILIVLAAVLGASGVGLLRLGGRLLRGLQLLARILLDWLRRFVAAVRRMLGTPRSSRSSRCASPTYQFDKR